MSSKTKIVVLHMKEIIYTAVFAALAIILILLLVFMFLPKIKSPKPTRRNTCQEYTHPPSRLTTPPWRWK